MKTKSRKQQSFNDTLKTLRKGDIFRLTSTLRVQSLDEVGVLCEEVRGGGMWSVSPEEGDNTSAKIQIVRKAAQPRKPRRQDFKEGDVISAETLREVMWVRGTMVRLASFAHRHGFVLHADGRWYSIASDDSFGFEDFHGQHYEIAHLPK